MHCDKFCSQRLDTYVNLDIWIRFNDERIIGINYIFSWNMSSSILKHTCARIYFILSAFCFLRSFRLYYRRFLSLIIFSLPFYLYFLPRAMINLNKKTVCKWEKKTEGTYFCKKRKKKKKQKSKFFVFTIIYIDRTI